MRAMTLVYFKESSLRRKDSGITTSLRKSITVVSRMAMDDGPARRGHT